MASVLGLPKMTAGYCVLQLEPSASILQARRQAVDFTRRNGRGGCPRSSRTAGCKKCELLTAELHFDKRMWSSAASKQGRRKKYDALLSIVSVAATSSVEFPRDYEELLDQVRTATSAALKDSKMLIEIEFPTAGLDTVPGDAEGGIEMSTSMLLVREFCRVFSAEKASRTRIFFPDISEVESARKNVFEGTPYKLDYLSKPSGLEDFGFGKKEKMADHVQSADAVFVAAYPYFNVNEMIAVEELYKDSAEASRRPIIVFNGELDRIRSGYYPSFFYPKLGALARNFLPKFETVYYIHNFKGRSGGTLFRAYPGPWQVLRRVNYKFECIHEQETMPTLKEVQKPQVNEKALGLQEMSSKLSLKSLDQSNKGAPKSLSSLQLSAGSLDHDNIYLVECFNCAHM